MARRTSLAVALLATALLGGCAALDDIFPEETILEQTTLGSPRNPNVTFMRQVVEPAGGRTHIRVLGINGTDGPLCMSVKATPSYADEYERRSNKAVAAGSRVTLGTYELRDNRRIRTHYGSPDPDGVCRTHKE